MEHLKRSGVISRKEYAAMAKVSLRQANNDLDDLLKKNIFVQIGAGRATKYRVRD